MKKNFLSFVFACFLACLLMVGCGTSGDDNNIRDNAQPNSVAPSPKDLPEKPSDSEKFPPDLSEFCSELPKVSGETGSLVLNFSVPSLERKKDGADNGMGEVEYILASDQEKRIRGYEVYLSDPNGYYDGYYGRLYIPNRANNSIQIPGIKVSTYRISIYSRGDDWHSAFHDEKESVAIHCNETTNVFFNLRLQNVLSLVTHISGLENSGLEKGVIYQVSSFHQEKDQCSAWDREARYNDNVLEVTMDYFDFRTEDAAKNRFAELAINDPNAPYFFRVIYCTYNLRSTFHDGIIEMQVIPSEETILAIQPKFSSSGNELYNYLKSQVVNYCLDLYQDRWHLKNFSIPRSDREISIQGMAKGDYSLRLRGMTSKEERSLLYGQTDLTLKAGDNVQIMEMDFNDNDNYTTVLPARIESLLLKGENLEVWEGKKCDNYGGFSYDDSNHIVNSLLSFKSPLENKQEKVQLAIKKDGVVVKILGYVYNVWDIIEYGYVPLRSDPGFQSGTLAADINFAHHSVMCKIERDMSMSSPLKYVGGQVVSSAWLLTVGPYEDLQCIVSLKGELLKSLQNIRIFINDIQEGATQPRESDQMEFPIRKLEKGKFYKIHFSADSLPGHSAEGSLELTCKVVGGKTGNVYFTPACEGQTISVVPNGGLEVNLSPDTPLDSQSVFGSQPLATKV